MRKFQFADVAERIARQAGALLRGFMVTRSSLCSVGFYVVCLVGICKGQGPTRDSGNQGLGSSHGTINIILSNQNGLVAVTDSTLTYNGTKLHTDDAIKLFKLDDKTICTMAGQYSNGLKDDYQGMSLLIPQVMQTFIKRLQNPISRDRSFFQKALMLMSHLQFSLTTHLQAFVSNGGDISQIQPIYLTVAGYDLDGSLRIAELDFEPTKTDSGVEFEQGMRPRSANPPTCELSIGIAQQKVDVDGVDQMMRTRTTGKLFFCEAVGLSNAAEGVLLHPDHFASRPAIAAYLNAKIKGNALTSDEMIALAVELVHQTELDENLRKSRGVGGSPEIAVLSDGKVSSFTGNPLAKPIDPDIGTDLGASHGSHITYSCSVPTNNGIGFMPSKFGMLMQAEVTGCRQPIDGFIFHDSVFVNSSLTYSGESHFEFADTNKIVNTSLTLGPKVDVRRPEVHNLICGFGWTVVTQNGTSVERRCATQVK